METVCQQRQFKQVDQFTGGHATQHRDAEVLEIWLGEQLPPQRFAFAKKRGCGQLPRVG